MKPKYWRFSKCPHDWEKVSAYYNLWMTVKWVLFCPHCGHFRKVVEVKGESIVNSQKLLKQHGYTD